jgi:ribosomal protein S18 acetylase RimI-like enzyme
VRVVYRPATKEDVSGIVTVFLDCWRGSYRAVLPERLIDAMTDQKAHDLWARVLGEATSGEILVADGEAEEPDAVDASGAPPSRILGVTRFAAGPAGHGAVHSLYVSRRAQGVGVGSRLLCAAGTALVEAGMVTAGLWVFRDNAPSLAFYQRQGWTPNGETRVQAEFGEPELSLTRVLAAPSTFGSNS